MAEKVPQTLANHAKFVPLYHYFLSLLVLVNLLWSIWWLIQHQGLDAVVRLLAAVALLVIFLLCRTFPLKVQDRLIRLEERLRLAELTTDDAVRARLHELTPQQAVALRFASDEEAPALAKQVLDEGLTDTKAIKQRIKTWRPDYHRM